jgi:hypothetical protein
MPRRSFGPSHENKLGQRLIHNDELYELLDEPDVVEYIKFKWLQWASDIILMDNTSIRKKLPNEKFHGRRPVTKTTEMERRQAGLQVRAWCEVTEDAEKEGK